MAVCNLITKDIVRNLMPQRINDSSKGTYGKVLNIAGCKEYVGAAYLSSVAALKVGAGIVELAAPTCVKAAVSSMSPDITYSEVSGYSYINALPAGMEIDSYSAVSFGCGLGNNKHTHKFVNKFLNNIVEFSKPIVYDADALNIIAEEGITSLGKNVILTPHPGEMARLMQVLVTEVQNAREEYAIKAAKKYNAVVVLKGHNTLIANPDGGVFKDVSGTNVLAKAGMGDVLTGIISGLCAQGVSAQDAAILGVYIHSQAGLCGESVSTQYGLLASELLTFIPDGIKSIIF